MPARFKVEQVRHHRQGHRVLNQISHFFADGLIHAIIGPNGAGKTSLLRLLGLLEKPDQGRIFFLDQDTTSLWPQCLNLRRRLGYLHQNPLLFQGTVFDNLAVGLKYRQVPRKERQERVENILEGFGLTSLARRPAAALSGGEAQKVALGRIMIFEPEVLLLDEPTSGLDPISTGKVEESLLELKRHYTIVIVPHSVQQASRVADSAAFFLMGELIEYRPGRELFMAPRDRRTEDYITGRFG
jgi:ABC-type phosphate transport system ATPase subunit